MVSQGVTRVRAGLVVKKWVPHRKSCISGGSGASHVKSEGEEGGASAMIPWVGVPAEPLLLK